MKDLKTIGDRVISIMEIKGITLLELSVHLDREADNLERKIRNLSTKDRYIIKVLANVLDVDSTWLLYGVPEDMLKAYVETRYINIKNILTHVLEYLHVVPKIQC